jgi:hypothetical protein
MSTSIRGSNSKPASEPCGRSDIDVEATETQISVSWPTQSDWQLTTTLDRRDQQRTRLNRHFGLIYRIRPQVETFTGTKWAIPTPPEYNTWLKDFDTLMPVNYPAYDFASNPWP